MQFLHCRLAAYPQSYPHICEIKWVGFVRCRSCTAPHHAPDSGYSAAQVCLLDRALEGRACVHPLRGLFFMRRGTQFCIVALSKRIPRETPVPLSGPPLGGFFFKLVLDGGTTRLFLCFADVTWRGLRVFPLPPNLARVVWKGRAHRRGLFFCQWANPLRQFRATRTAPPSGCIPAPAQRIRPLPLGPRTARQCHGEAPRTIAAGARLSLSRTYSEDSVAGLPRFAGGQPGPLLLRNRSSFRAFELSSRRLTPRARRSQAFAAEIRALARRSSGSRSARLMYIAASFRHSADVRMLMR